MGQAGNRQICCCDDNKGGDFSTSRAVKISRRGPEYYQKRDPLNQSTMIAISKNYPPNAHYKQATSGIRESGSMKRQQSVKSSSQKAIEAVRGFLELKDLEVNKGEKLHKNPTQGFEPQPDHLEKKQSMPEYFELNRHNRKINDASILGIQNLNPNVKETFQKNRFSIIDDFDKQPINWQTLPDGFYKYVRSDGSLYIGHFEEGKAHGRGVYIFIDGSYYEGQFKNDMADGYGSYYSRDLIYKGEFRQNTFEGKGIENGPKHSYNGLYMKGEKYHGVFQWKDQDGQYTYKGSFDEEGRFFGEATLIEPTGSYEGNFKFGLKHGEGTYRFTNDYTYKGTYRNNVREGPGKLISPLNKTVFDGEFEEGLPVTQDLQLKKMASLFSQRGSNYEAFSPTKE